MTVRIHGDALDIDDTYVDVDIGSYHLDGTVELTEKDTNRSWTVEPDDLNRWQNSDDLLSHEDIEDKNHDLWKMVEGIDGAADGTRFDDIARDVNSLSKRLFKALVRSAKGKT